jgi:formate-dependent nitrite reductase membrane component NrfD
MSIGTWLLTFFIGISILYAYTYIEALPVPFGERTTWRRALAWVNVPLGLAVAVYTGVLLGAMPSRPFWNSPILAMLFMLSALSTGVALIIFARALLSQGSRSDAQREVAHRSGYILAASDAMLVGFEVLTLFLFLMFAYLSVGNVRYAIATILPGGPLASLFWIGVVLIGLVLPGLLELYYVVPALLYRRQYAVSRYTEMAIAVAILFGGLVLRYVVVVAGQITGPVGLRGCHDQQTRNPEARRRACRCRACRRPARRARQRIAAPRWRGDRPSHQGEQGLLADHLQGTQGRSECVHSVRHPLPDRRLRRGRGTGEDLAAVRLDPQRGHALRQGPGGPEWRVRS